MEQTPYPNFWKEEPRFQKKAWRPTDESRRKIQMFGLVQFLLLIGILVIAVFIAKETKKMPPVMAQLPNGLVFEASRVEPGLSLIARKGLVNNVLTLLYYQEGSQNQLALLKQNVRMTILKTSADAMARSAKLTNTTVNLEIIETFETAFRITANRNWFEAMTKANLVKQDKKAKNEAPCYLRTHWEMEGGRYVLTGIIEAMPGDYYQAFLAEKERLHKLTAEELQRELNVRKNTPIPVPDRKTGKL